MGLEDMIGQESYQEILDVLSPGELVVVAYLVTFDVTLNEIAEDLGLTKQAVSARVRRAAERVAEAFPDRAYRAHRPRRYPRPAADDWERMEAFVLAVIDVQQRGELVTLGAVARELEQHRSTVYRTFLRVQELGLVDYEPHDGRLRPVRLTISGDLTGAP